MLLKIVLILLISNHLSILWTQRIAQACCFGDFSLEVLLTRLETFRPFDGIQHFLVSET